MLRTVMQELREIAWLASVVTSLSVIGVGVALAIVVT